MIKKIILSLLIIGGVGASAVAGTQALLSDTVTLTANAISTGTVDLQIAVNGQTNYENTQTGFVETILPGQSKIKSFRLKNNASGVALSIAAQATNVSGLPSNKVLITFTPWTTSSTTSGSPEPGSSPTTHTLADWVGGASLGNPNIASNGVQDYRMEVSIDQSVSTAGSSTFDFVFTGTQVVPTPTP